MDKRKRFCHFAIYVISTILAGICAHTRPANACEMCAYARMVVLPSSIADYHRESSRMKDIIQLKLFRLSS